MLEQVAQRVSAMFYDLIPSPLCTEENQAQHFSWRISKPKDFRDKIHVNLTVSITWDMPANMAFRQVEIFAFSVKRLRFSDFFICLLIYFPSKVENGKI